MRPEKITEITIAVAPGFMVGHVIEVGAEPFIIVGIVHQMGGFSTTRLRVAEPHWRWRLQYKTRRFFRRVWRIITRSFQRLREKAGGG